jgi:hypothetical protein
MLRVTDEFSNVYSSCLEDVLEGVVEVPRVGLALSTTLFCSRNTS